MEIILCIVGLVVVGSIAKAVDIAGLTFSELRDGCLGLIILAIAAYFFLT